MTQPLLDPAAWWRGLGIGVWVYGNGMTRNLDNTPLDVISRPGAEPRLLAETLSVQTTRVLADTRDAVAVVADISHGVNGGRVFWDAKQVQICTPAARPCHPVVVDSSKVTVDPAWSPNGRQLAFVEAPDRRTGGWGQHALTEWYAEHVLRLYDIRSRRLRTIATATGATAPMWSRDGKSLLYVADDGLWLLPGLETRPVRIAAPLYRPAGWPSYFGQIAWTAQLAWWSP
jgi:WD40 repeat protein